MFYLKRVAWILVGGLFGGAIAAGLSTVLSEPYPMAVGIAVGVPVMDVGLYPAYVPDDRAVAARVGVLAGVCGVVVGVLAAAILLAVDAPAQNAQTALAVAAAFLATEYGGWFGRSRLT